MPIIKEYKCLDCETLFESSSIDPACPKCTSEEQERVFLTPPSINSQNTGRRDKMLTELAADHNLSNMNNRGGAAIKKAPEGPEAPRFDSTASPVMGALARLQGKGDGLSGVLPSIQGRGPRTWNKVRERR